LELLGVVKAVTHFRKYVYGRPFEVVTDHKGLTVAQAAKCSTRGQRMLLRLEDYDYRITYRKGARNVVPDALSRQHEQDDGEDDGKVPASQKTGREAEVLLAETTWDPDFQFVLPDEDEWRTTGRTCKFCGPIIKLLTGDLSDHLSCRLGAKKAIDRHVITLHQGVLKTEKGQRIVPELLRGRIITLYHYTPFAAHLATAKMVPLIKELFFWPELHEDVEAMVASCLDCRLIKSTPLQGAIAVRHLSPEPFSWLAMDHVGPLPSSKNGNEYLLVVLDVFSSWVEAFPVKNTSAEIVASILWKEVMARYGVPKVILSDSSRSFKGRLMAALAKELKITLRFTTVRHPQANGGVERVNKTLKQCLGILAKGMDWEQALPSVLFAIRRSPRAPLWLSPATVLFGRNIKGPVESLLEESMLVEPANNVAERIKVYQMVRKELVEATLAARQKVADAHPAPTQHLRIKEGELVLTFNPKALIDDARRVKPKWEGPFIVIKQTSATTFMVLYRGKPKILHVSRMVVFDPALTPEGSPAMLEVRKQRELYQSYLKKAGLSPEQQQLERPLGQESRPTTRKMAPEPIKTTSLSEIPGVSCKGIRIPVPFRPKRARISPEADEAKAPTREAIKESEEPEEKVIDKAGTGDEEADEAKASTKEAIEESEEPEEKVIDKAGTGDEHADEIEVNGLDSKHRKAAGDKPEGIVMVTGRDIGTMLVKVLSPDLAQKMRSYSSKGVFRPVFTDVEGHEHYQEGEGLAPEVISLDGLKVLQNNIYLERGRLPEASRQVWQESLTRDILYFKTKYGL